MGVSAAILGLTEKAGSRKDSLNFPFTFVPLVKKKRVKHGSLSGDNLWELH